jgi:hypothetical protein
MPDDRDKREQKEIPRDARGKPVEQHHRSSLVERFEAGPRYWHKTLDLSRVLGGMLNHDGTPVVKVTFRINKKADEDTAVAAAHAIVHRLAKLAEAGEAEFKQDGDVLQDNKHIQVLYRACRDPENADRTLFPTPEWMRQNLETNEIAGLLNAYAEVVCRKHGIPWSIEDVDLDNTRTMLVAARDSELPERLLAMFDRPYLTTLLTLVCCRWHDERQRACAVLAELAVEADENAPWRNEAQGLIEEWQVAQDGDEAVTEEDTEHG